MLVLTELGLALRKGNIAGLTLCFVASCTQTPRPERAANTRSRRVSYDPFSEAPVADAPVRAAAFQPESSVDWTSPPECARETEDGFCPDCYGWPSPPLSLGRQADGDEFGAAVAISDFNGDGYPDVAVGAPGADIESYIDAGAVYVLLGTARGFEPWRRLDATDAGLGALEVGLRFGTTVATGDVDGDGLGDLAVTGGHADSELQIVFLLEGRPNGFEATSTLHLRDLDPDDHVEPGSEFGAALGFRDFDGDGDVDLAIGAPGQYVVADGVRSGAVYVLFNDRGRFELGARLTPSDMASTDDALRFGAHLTVGDFLPGGVGGGLAVADPRQQAIHIYDGGVHPLFVAASEALASDDDAIVAADWDADGVDELFAGGSGMPGTLEVFEDITTDGAYERIELTTSIDSAGVIPRGVVDLGYGAEPQVVAQIVPGDGVPPRVGLFSVDGSALEVSIGESVAREPADYFGHGVVIADTDGDGERDLIVTAPSEAGSGAGRVYRFGVSDPSLWQDSDHWLHVWESAGYVPGMSGATYEDPMPSQVVTQETEIAECDHCYVFTLPDATVCGTEPLRACFDEACTEFCHSQSDGTACGDGTGTEICVFKACVTRGCGDGYRQTGALWSPRESCDDQNNDDGDACSATCESERLVVSSRSETPESLADIPPSVAADGYGNLLFVYAADGSTSRRLLAQRLTWGGATPPGDPRPIELAADVGIGWDPQPSVAGLADGGWVVAWADPAADGEGAGIATRRVFADGALGPVRVANEDAAGGQREPRVAPLDGGYVVVWTDDSGLGGPLGGSVIEARRFDETGAPIEGDWRISALGRTSSQPTLAAVGSNWIVAWTDTPDGFFVSPAVHARRFGAWTDGAPFVVSETAGASPALAELEGDFVVVWVRRDPSFDPLGDIQSRIVFATGDEPLTGSVVETIAATTEPELAPSVASLGGGEYLVAYEDGGRRRGLAFAHVGMSTLASEATDLSGFLVDGLQSDVTLLRTSRGVWFAWSDATSFGDPAAHRSFLAYLLPID